MIIDILKHKMKVMTYPSNGVHNQNS